ncbi:MAG: hypothetical protein ACI83Y_002489 [Candidatus Azotimanducaceae bacterium]
MLGRGHATLNFDGRGKFVIGWLVRNVDHWWVTQASRVADKAPTRTERRRDAGVAEPVVDRGLFEESIGAPKCEAEPTVADLGKQRFLILPPEVCHNSQYQ